MNKKQFNRAWARQEKRFQRAERKANRLIHKIKTIYIPMMNDAIDQKKAIRKEYEGDDT